MIKHLSLSIEGALKKAKDFVGCIETEDGKTLNTVAEVKAFFKEQLDMGRKYLPYGECDNFDYQHGCKGHPSEKKETGQ